MARGDAVSKLSPYLHFGQISPRTVMRRLASAGAQNVSKTFWRRLVWRDLAYWQLHHWPQMPTRSLRPSYDDQSWDFNPGTLKRWQAGQTGFPLVDAGMRELWHTGYMHQNVRMVVACFLTEYLNYHWVHGARWFHDTLVDADLAINSMMWQNAGKSGLDQWNFSILPTSRAADSKGDYVRRCDATDPPLLLPLIFLCEGSAALLMVLRHSVLLHDAHNTITSCVFFALLRHAAAFGGFLNGASLPALRSKCKKDSDPGAHSWPQRCSARTVCTPGT